MADLDLIPAEYRRSLRLRRWLRNFLLVYAAAVLAVAGVRTALSRGVDGERREIERLRQTKQVTLNQLALVEELNARKADARKRLEILAGLRGGPPAEQMFVVIDQALANRDIWFQSWNFRRAGELVEAEPQAVEAGYFIVVPKGPDHTKEAAWRLRTHMEIKGQARSHSALATFVDRLLDQPEIEQVRIISTSLRRYTTAQLVDFELAVVVDSRPEGT